MKINAAVTLLFQQDGLLLEIHDQDAGIEFLRLKLDQKATCNVLSRLAHVRCDADVYGLEKVGLKVEMDSLEFKVNHSHRNKEAVIAEAIKACPEGWTPDKSFSSQGSFFERDGESYARTTIRRWVKPSDIIES